MATVDTEPTEVRLRSLINKRQRAASGLLAALWQWYIEEKWENQKEVTAAWPCARKRQ